MVIVIAGDLIGRLILLRDTIVASKEEFIFRNEEVYYNGLTQFLKICVGKLHFCRYDAFNQEDVYPETSSTDPFTNFL